MPDIVDTNVLAVANFKAPQASDACTLMCIEYLENRDKIFAVDSEDRIFAEYRAHANHSGQPGVGDAFFKWLWEHQAMIEHCQLVEITDSGDDTILFEEIPNDERIKGFDPADQKFLAVAIACNPHGFVFNAVDSDWLEYAEVIRDFDITVMELCVD